MSLPFRFAGNLGKKEGEFERVSESTNQTNYPKVKEMEEKVQLEIILISFPYNNYSISLSLRCRRLIPKLEKQDFRSVEFTVGKNNSYFFTNITRFKKRQSVA